MKDKVEKIKYFYVNQYERFSDMKIGKTNVDRENPIKIVHTNKENKKLYTFRFYKYLIYLKCNKR